MPDDAPAAPQRGRCSLSRGPASVARRRPGPRPMHPALALASRAGWTTDPRRQCDRRPSSPGRPAVSYSKASRACSCCSLPLAAWRPLAQISRRPASASILAGLAGIGWVLFDGFLLSGRGTLGTLLVARRPHREALRASLGWGALIYMTAMAPRQLWLARRGWLKGDVFTIARAADRGRQHLHVRRLSGAVHPRFGGARTMAASTSPPSPSGSATAPSGASAASRPGTCGVAWNTLLLAALVGLLSTLLGLAFALIASRTRFPFQAAVARPDSILPIITPPFVIGLALILLFGRAGLVTAFLIEWLRHPAQPLDLRPARHHHRAGARLHADRLSGADRRVCRASGRPGGGVADAARRTLAAHSAR